MAVERGVIRNRAFAQQIRDFSGLRFGNITPTDIDAFIEVADRTFILMESKHGTSPLPLGQRLALERLVDACFEAGKDAILFILTHNTREDIDYANCQVIKYRYEKVWHDIKEPITAKEACQGFIDAAAARRKAMIEKLVLHNSQKVS